MYFEEMYIQQSFPNTTAIILPKHDTPPHIYLSFPTSLGQGDDGNTWDSC